MVSDFLKDVAGLSQVNNQLTYQIHSDETADHDSLVTDHTYPSINQTMTDHTYPVANQIVSRGF